MVVLGTQVELCKARGHAAGLAEGLGARDHGRRRRRGGGAVAALKSGQVGPLDLFREGRRGTRGRGGGGEGKEGGGEVKQADNTVRHEGRCVCGF